jgi:flagellar biosynthesis protein FlhG
VLLLDGDFNLANLHLLLGVEPVARIETLLHGDARPEDLVIAVHQNLWVLPGDSGGEQLHTLGTVDKARLFHRLTGVSDQYDVVVVDAGAGIESVVRCCAVPSAHPIIVTVPEPAALADAYAVIKIINFQAGHVPVTVLVNRVDSDAQGRAAFERLEVASQRFLQEPLNYLGAVPEDELLRRAVREASPFWLGDTPLVRSIKEHIDHGRALFGLDAPAAAGTG